MSARFDRNPHFVAAFILILTFVQLGAFTRQFAKGYRPLRNEPVRVAFSWDMFANRVERCVINWTPPIETPVGPMSSLRQFGTKLEWDVVYDHESDYDAIAKWVCMAGRGQPQIHLRCFLPNGSEENHDHACS